MMAAYVVGTRRPRLAAAYWHSAAPLDLKLLDAQHALPAREPSRGPPGNDVVIVGLDEAVPRVDARAARAAASAPRALPRRDDARASPRWSASTSSLPARSYRFLAPSRPSGDQLRRDPAARAAAGQARGARCVFAKTWDVDARSFRPILVDYVVAARAGGQVCPSPATPIARASVLVCADEDGTVRRFPDAQCQPDGSGCGMAAKLAAYAGNAQVVVGLHRLHDRRAAPLHPARARCCSWLESGDEAKLAVDLRRPRGAAQADPASMRTATPCRSSSPRWEPGSAPCSGVLIHAQSVRSIMRHRPAAHPVPPILERCSRACSVCSGGCARPWLGGDALRDRRRGARCSPARGSCSTAHVRRWSPRV